MKILSVLAGLLMVIAYVPYVSAIIRKESTPTKATWLIWASLDTIVFIGMLFKGTASGQILGAVLGSWVVAILALKYGASGWTKLDKFCIGSTVLGIVLWFVFSNPILGIITSLVVMLIGSIPTYISAWKDPHHENMLAWIIFLTSSVFAVIAIPHWTISDAAQPIVFLIIQAIMMYILIVRARVRQEA